MFILIASDFASAFTILKATYVPIDKMAHKDGQFGIYFKLD
jgi:hypothetical protein